MWPRLSLFWKVFAVNATVLIAAGLTLALSPATVSRPITLREAAILVAGVCALLVVNLALMHRAFAPLSRLTSGMANVDPLKPGLRLDVHDDPELGALAASFNAMADRLEGERRASSARLLIAQEDDRRRIAAELHDEVGQQLTALLLTLDRLADQPDPDVQREARAAREIVRGSLDQLRALGPRPAAPGLGRARPDRGADRTVAPSRRACRPDRHAPLGSPSRATSTPRSRSSSTASRRNA